MNEEFQLRELELRLATSEIERIIIHERHSMQDRYYLRLSIVFIIIITATLVALFI